MNLVEVHQIMGVIITFVTLVAFVFAYTERCVEATNSILVDIMRHKSLSSEVKPLVADMQGGGQIRWSRVFSDPFARRLINQRLSRAGYKADYFKVGANSPHPSAILVVQEIGETV